MIRDLRRKGVSISEIARQTGRDRKTVRKIVNGALTKGNKKRWKKATKLGPYEGYLKQRIGEGVLNTRKLLRELKERGYSGGLTQVILYVPPYRTSREERAVMRYETRPGEQAQVDWGSFGFITQDGRQQRLYAFAMLLGYSRMLYVEFTTRVDISSWLRCHQHAFAYLGDVPEVMLHDNGRETEDERHFRRHDLGANAPVPLTRDDGINKGVHQLHLEINQRTMSGCIFVVNLVRMVISSRFAASQP